MAEWIFDKYGKPKLIYDLDCIRNSEVYVIAWISKSNLYSLQGSHLGWYENGVFYDSQNKILGFLSKATGYLPSRPGISGSPGMPGFHGRPGSSGFSGVPGRPGFVGWSEHDLISYF